MVGGRTAGKDYGEFLRGTTTLWAIIRISGTGFPIIAQDIKYDQTCRRWGRPF